MNINDLENISLRGKIAYAIMCIEKYLTIKYPNKDWAPLAEAMWGGTHGYLDEWGYKMIEIIPEDIFEFDEYTDFEYISYDEWIIYRELLTNTSEDLNQLLIKLQQIQEVYVYSSITDHGLAASELVIDISTYLLKEEINLPDLSFVSFSTYDQDYGYGHDFDGRYLSIIL